MRHEMSGVFDQTYKLVIQHSCKVLLVVAEQRLDSNLAFKPSGYAADQRLTIKEEVLESVN